MSGECGKCNEHTLDCQCKEGKMDITYADAKNMKNLEQYAVALIVGMFSLKTLEDFQLRAIEIGIMPEDLNCRANTILWDMKRILKLYRDQLESVLELLPVDFKVDMIIENLKKQQLTKARSMIRKNRVKECVM
jgi:hypothetical protein